MKNTDAALRGWQSDVIVDLIQRYDFDYITMNPGASFRGLHGRHPGTELGTATQIGISLGVALALKAKGRIVSISSRMGTSCSTPARCGSRQNTRVRC